MTLVDGVPPELHPRILNSQSLPHRLGVVGGAIIDNEDAHVDACLAQDTLDALDQKSSVVVARYADSHAPHRATRGLSVAECSGSSIGSIHEVLIIGLISS